MDNTQEKMLKIDSKLKAIVANTSQCKLWVVIIIEIILLVLIIIG